MPEISLHLENCQFFNAFIFVIDSQPKNIELKVSDFEVSQFSRALILDILQYSNIDEKSVTFMFTIVTKPEVKLGEYKGIAIEKVKYEVSDESIQDELNKMLLKKYSRLRYKEFYKT